MFRSCTQGGAVSKRPSSSSATPSLPPSMFSKRLLLLPALLVCAPMLLAQSAKKEPREFLPAPFDQYCSRRVAELSSPDWQKGITPENWPAKQAEMRRQLQGMLGLDPWPARGDLHPVI